MIRWLATNLRTFMWAFAMALAVWLAAVSAADPDEVHRAVRRVQRRCGIHGDGRISVRDPVRLTATWGCT